MLKNGFEYLKPSSLEEASKLLMDCKNSMILAGGTELMVSIRNGNHSPERVVDVKEIPELAGIRWEDGHLFVGASNTWTDIMINKTLAENFPAFMQAAKVFGCSEIRNRATLGGNICNASPGAEAGGPCMVYEAKVKIWGSGKERIIPINEFFTGPGKNSIQQGEIMTGILLPLLPEGSRSAYRRITRVKGQDLATCAITIAIINPDEIETRRFRVGFSAVMRTPARSPELEEILSGKVITPEVLKSAKLWLRENLQPRASSLRGTPDYKRDAMGGMLEILLRGLKLLG
jgi:CO/xanthine dehydrogenase FAD-binding subunit